MKPEPRATQVFTDSLEHWNYGKASGIYNPFTDEIHVLKADDLYFRALMHEKIHAGRRSKITFRVGCLAQLPIVVNFLFAILIFLAVSGIIFQALSGFSFVTAFTPFLFSAGLFSTIMFCHAYEEMKADNITEQGMREGKLIDEGLRAVKT